MSRWPQNNLISHRMKKHSYGRNTVFAHGRFNYEHHLSMHKLILDSTAFSLDGIEDIM